jgi:hypothetical protein
MYLITTVDTVKTDVLGFAITISSYYIQRYVSKFLAYEKLSGKKG